MSGTLLWKIEDDQGITHELKIPNSYYVPQANARLLSPQHWAREARDNKPLPRGTWCATYDDQIVLEWGQRKFRRTIKLDKRGSNVATIRTAPSYDKYHAYCAEIHDTIPDNDDDPVTYESNIVSDDENDSDSEDTDEDFYDTVTDEQEMNALPRDTPMQTSFEIPTSNPVTEPTTIEVDEDELPPENVAAQMLRLHNRLGHLSMQTIQRMAKMKLLPTKFAKCEHPICPACLFGKQTRRPWRSSAINESEIHQVTAPGQCVSVDQLESSTPGLVAHMKGSPTIKRYTSATVFVDHFSRLGFVYLQKSTNAEETIQAKEAFERYSNSHGVKILHYHADNGRFAENKWTEHVKASSQTMSFSGVNAHHQNGVAERRIRHLQDQARTMLIHAQKRWPQAVDAHLWPYALRMANDVHNSTISNKDKNQAPINLFSKSNVQVNLKHFFTFGCPVYVLDSALQQRQKIAKWQERSRIGIYLGQSPNHSRTVALVLNPMTGHVSPQFHIRLDPTFQTVKKFYHGEVLLQSWQELCGFRHSDKQVRPSEGAPVLQQIKHTRFRQPPSTDLEGAPAIPIEHLNRSENVQATEQQLPESQATVQDEGLRRSSRQRTPAVQPDMIYYESLIYQDADIDPIQSDDPIELFAAYTQKSRDPDVMHLHQAMKQPDREQFIDAMIKEVDDLTKTNQWTIIHRHKVPQGTPVLPLVWSMRRKRRISTHEVYKWKSRLTFDGSKQKKGVNYWETYAPVASWPTIRLLLTMSLLNNWKTRQIDYVLAYTQAPPETQMYAKLPRGFTVDGNPNDYVLKINKNYYGQKQAGRIWYLHLVKKLKECGFTQSQHDDCLFYHGNAIYVLYTDDSILAGPDDKELDAIMKKMADSGLKLTQEGNLEDFLGVKIEKCDDGSFRLTQPHLIDSILKDLRLQGPGTATKDIPAPTSVLLRRHTHSEDFDRHFDYRSVIGKLNYLEKCTRPDIAYATHQCARFCIDPKKEHGKAVKWIGRYLLATKDKGLILRPDPSKALECYADADFAGNWHKEDAEIDIDTARSRTGYLVTFAGCPLTWQSKLQTEIALSTTEAEYIALSTGLRTVIPLIETLKEMHELKYPLPFQVTKVFCKAFEDNSGALELATVPKMRPRTKHINIKYHHFRSHVSNGSITIHKITTDNQPIDIATKPLASALFKKHREFIAGW
jgi:hypothetical protein